MNNWIDQVVLGWCGLELVPLGLIVLLGFLASRQKRLLNEEESELLARIASYEEALGMRNREDRG